VWYLKPAVSAYDEELPIGTLLRAYPHKGMRYRVPLRVAESPSQVGGIIVDVSEEYYVIRWFDELDGGVAVYLEQKL